MSATYITINDAAIAFAEATQNIATSLVPKVFSGVSLPNSQKVNEELFFLAVYVIDGLIKNPVNQSWADNCERIAKEYYSKCAALLGEDHWTFAARFLERASFYNAALMQHVAVANLPNHDDRITQIAILVGAFFADLCGQPEDAQHKLIGASAYSTLNLITERVFGSQLVAQ